MDNPEFLPGQSTGNGIHDWARLEGKSTTMVEELACRHEATTKPRTRRQRLALTGGLVIYLALALGLSAWYLSRRSSILPEHKPPARLHFFEPKYLTSTLRN